MADEEKCKMRFARFSLLNHKCLLQKKNNNNKLKGFDHDVVGLVRENERLKEKCTWSIDTMNYKNK